MKARTKSLFSVHLLVVVISLFISGALSLSFSFVGPDGSGARADRHGDPVIARSLAVDTDDGDEDGEDDGGEGNDYVLPVSANQVSSIHEESTQARQASGFDAFNAHHGNRWKATFANESGKVKVLYGAQSKRYANGPEAVATEFLRDTHAMFGLKKELTDLSVRRVDKTPVRDHVRLQQTHNGIPVTGALVLVHSTPEGQVTMVQNDYKEGLQVANVATLSEEAARNIALNDLKLHAEIGVGPSGGKAEQVIVPHKGAYLAIWKIALPSWSHPGYWVYHIDAYTGDIVYRGNEIFSTKTGKGYAYKTNADWHMNKIKSAPLKYMFTESESASYWGYLFGSHADIYNNNGWPFEEDYKFFYDPITQKDQFDATTAYYKITTTWEWWNKNVIAKFGPGSPSYFHWYSMPAFLDQSFCNAYYTSDTGYGSPGFLFGAQGQCAYGSEDLALDDDVVRHEYTHAMMDWCGFDGQFGGPLHYYGRSMGEGNADWFSYIAKGDSIIADVAWAWDSVPYLRNIDNTRRYPHDVDYPGWGTPEEHYTGEIWGGYLYDLSRVLKKKALPYVYNSFYYFSPAGGHMSDYPDFLDGIMAQIGAEYDLTGKYSSSLKVWGSMSGRGILAARRSPYSHPTNYFYSGSGGSDSNPFFSYVLSYFKKISTTGNLLLSGDRHEYPISLGSTLVGKNLTVKVTAKSGGLINPSISVYNFSGDLLAEVGPSSASSAFLAYPIAASGTHIIVVTGTATASARGYYKLTVATK